MLWERLYRLKQTGVTLVLTTHYMDEAEQLCDRLVIMDGGRIVAEGSPRELIAEHATREVVELRFAHARGARRRRCRAWSQSRDASRRSPTACSCTPTTARSSRRPFTRRRHAPRVALVRRGTLEDVFLILTGRTLED